MKDREVGGESGGFERPAGLPYLSCRRWYSGLTWVWKSWLTVAFFKDLRSIEPVG
jgi:hypothetical protein